MLKTHTLLMLFFWGIAHTVQADSLQTIAGQLRDQALQSSRGWQIVESLTTEVGPRLAGTAADHAAVKWATTLLETPLADSAGFDRVWLEPVQFPLWQRHKERAQILSPFPQPLQISALGYSGSTGGELQAEVLAFTDLESLSNADASQVSGKIVFINQTMARHREGAGYVALIPVRYKAGAIAKALGAKAVLIRSLGTDSHRFPHTGSTQRDQDPLPAAALSAPDADQLQRIIDRGEKIMLALDIAVSEQDSGHSWNVMAQIDGREHPEQIILIAAHLDSWDLGTGAIDDGAGVAITTAAAQLIAALPERPRRSIRLVLFANEEQGIWGAKAYAKRHADELAQHRLASESDFGAGRVWLFESDQPQLVNHAKPLLESLNIDIGMAATHAGPDIKPLIDAGVSIFRLKQDGSDYFDYHHTADDTLDKIDAEALKQNIAAWSVVTYLAAELEELQ